MDQSYVKAPTWRRVAGGIVDAAILWRLPRNARVPVTALVEVVREQVGSPGQLLLGVRTVDRRTGERIAIWRSLAIGGATWGGQLLIRRLGNAPPDPEQTQALERYWQGLREIAMRHPDDPDAAAEERARLPHPPPLSVDIGRSVGPSVAVGLVMNRLRRQLAPTVEALSRRR